MLIWREFFCGLLLKLRFRTDRAISTFLPISNSTGQHRYLVVVNYKARFRDGNKYQ